MKGDARKQRRRSLRLDGYDYAAAGYYFITVCVQGKEPLLGEIVDQRVVLNEAGQMVDHWWNEMINKFETLALDRYVIMPNHFHGIIIIQRATAVAPDTVGANLCVRPGFGRHVLRGGHTGSGESGGHIGPPLPQVVQWFKTMTTNAYIHGVKNQNWPPFPGKLWQRNYYERIIRNERELHHIRQYIDNNPGKWADDSENPAHHRRIES